MINKIGITTPTSNNIAGFKGTKESTADAIRKLVKKDKPKPSEISSVMIHVNAAKKKGGQKLKEIQEAAKGTWFEKFTKP